MNDTHDILLDVHRAEIPRIDSFFGLWAIDETRFLSMFNALSGVDLSAHVLQASERVAASNERKPFRMNGSTAVVPLIGTLMKSVNSMDEGTSTIRARQNIRAAVNDADVDSIMLLIDSPGGTVDGTADLAAEVRRAAEAKPTIAFIEDLGASAAYWVASQASKVYANGPTAFVGSIGTFIGLYDLSAHAEREGIRAIVIASGKLKATGFPGTEITEAQQAMLTDLVMQTQAQFSREVKTGRGLSDAKIAEIEALAAIYSATDAEGLGLIDGLRTFEQTMEALRTSAATQRTRRSRSEAATSTESSDMADETADKTSEAAPGEVDAILTAPASVADIEAACPGADDSFVLAQVKAGATVDQAKDAYITQQQAAIESRDADLAELHKTPPRTGQDPVVGAGKTDPDADAEIEADAITEFDKRVRAKVQAGMDRRRAVLAVAKADRALHAQYLAATQPNATQRRNLEKRQAEQAA